MTITNLLLFLILLALVPGLVDVLGTISLGLVFLAALAAGTIALYLALPALGQAITALGASVRHDLTDPENIKGAAAIVVSMALVALIVIGLALVNNRLVARFGRKRAEWMTIGLFFALPFGIAGVLLILAFAADGNLMARTALVVAPILATAETFRRRINHKRRT